MLGVFTVRRPICGIDLQVRRISNDVAEFRTLKEIAGLEVENGVMFNLTSVSAIAIRMPTSDAGIRVKNESCLQVVCVSAPGDVRLVTAA